MKKILLLCSLAIGLNSFAQIPNGTTAPDFTLTDWNGNTHTLYDYLNDGKTVIVEVFAAHCPSCWSYHQTNILKDFYNNYGPNGTDEAMVLALEHDQYNGELAFTGVGDPWNTAGNWVDGTPYPLFNVEGTDRSVFDDYNVTYYPVIYKICPDKKTEMVFASTQLSELYQKVQDCQTAQIVEEQETWVVNYNKLDKVINIQSSIEIKSLQVVNLQGQIIQTHGKLNNTLVDVNGFENGVYLLNFETVNGPKIEKIVIF